MPKKYEYFVALSELKGDRRKRTNVTLNHPMTEADLNTIENKEAESTTDPYLYVVTNYKLLKVTGTFTYLFTYRMTRNGTDFLRSKVSVLDHRITSATLVTDYEKEISHLVKSSLLGSGVFFDILFHQEIPDE